MNRCRVTGCKGARWTNGLCMYHSHHPELVAPHEPPRSVPAPTPAIRRAPVVRIIDTRPRPPAAPTTKIAPPKPQCPHCGKPCASDLGVRFHVELKHPETAS